MMRVPLVWVACVLAGCALGAVISSAQSKRAPTQLPPLPVNEKRFPRALAPVVEAEHAFAQRSIDEGMKSAFLAYAAPDGVIVNRQGLVNAVEAWSQRNPAPEGLLTWWPTYADVSRAGDLGWTTGPFEFREKPSDEKAADTGHFFTVWRRQPDGAWKWVLDLGVRHPAPETTETVLRYPGIADAAPGPKPTDANEARASLAEAERSLSEESAAKGMRTALLARADASLRLYRQNTNPVVGKESVALALKVEGESITWKAVKTDSSASGDLGYAYGTYELRTRASDEKPAEHGYYARVWKRRPGGPWRVVLNVTNPAR